MSNIKNALATGTVVRSGAHDYRIEHVLGVGGFGITYIAVTAVRFGNISTEIKVAIKEHFLSDSCERGIDSRVVYSNPVKERVESSLRDFISEAQRLQKVGVGHPNIVKVNEVFEANNTAYYVMEYIDGESLRSYIKSNGPIKDIASLMELLAPVIDSVKYLHGRRMTHLDIKPDNIMLSKDGNGQMRPVLIDFGLSKHYNKSGAPTSTINVLGCSDGYAPVEQYAGITTFTPQADVYAVAATIVYCLTGKDPVKSTDISRRWLYDALAGCLTEREIGVIADIMLSPRATRMTDVARLSRQLSEGDSTAVGSVSGGNGGVKTRSLKKNVTAPTSVTPWGKIALGVGVLAALIAGAYFIFGDRQETTAYIEDDVTDAEEIAVVTDSVTVVTENLTPAPSIPANYVLVPSGTLRNHKYWDSARQSETIFDAPVDSFYISKYELTQSEYERVMGPLTEVNYTFGNDNAWWNGEKWVGTGKPKEAKGDSIPVQATFYDFIDYANKLSRAEGYDGFYSVEGDVVTVNPDGSGYRLPTVHEWMFAAKGANNHDTYKYAGSNTLKDVAWYGANSGNVPHKVGTKLPNSIGLYDMSGNLSEVMWAKTWDGGYGSESGVNYYFWTSTYLGDIFGVVKGSLGGVRLVFVPREIKNGNLEKDYPENTVRMKLRE